MKQSSSIAIFTLLQNVICKFKTPHLIWRTAGSNPYDVSEAIQQARLLSDHYR